MSAKRAADVHLAAGDLDFLIVRPGTLSDDPGTDQITAGIAVTYNTIPLDDVAAFIAAALFASELNRVAVELTAGDVPVTDAVKRLSARSWQA